MTVDHGIAANVDTANSIKADVELQALIQRVPSIQRYRKFRKWKQLFLGRLVPMLDRNGFGSAEQVIKDLDGNLKQLVSLIGKVQIRIDKGDLSNEKKTVRANAALNEMYASLTKVTGSVLALLPFTSREEKKRGYTKMHLTLVLLQHRCSQYSMMVEIKDSLEKFQAIIPGALDKARVDMIDTYKKELGRFLDSMKNLGFLEVMVKCHQFIDEPEDQDENLIEVLVKTTDETCFDLDVLPTSTIMDLKLKLQSEGYQVSPQHQVLSFQGTTLDDSEILEIAHIMDESVLVVHAVTFQVTIVDLTSAMSHQITVDPSRNLRYVMENDLLRITGLKPGNQYISIDGKQVVELDKTVDYNGVSPDTVIEVDSRTITICVKLPSGTSLPLELTKRKDTAASLMKNIEERTNISTLRQRLFFAGSSLPDGPTVLELAMHDGDEIALELHVVSIVVDIDGPDKKELELMVEPFDTMEALNKALEKASGIPHTFYGDLFMNGDRIEYNSTQSAVSYGVQADSKLHLKLKTEVKTKAQMPDGKLHSIVVTPQDTASVVKENIQAITGMTTARQVLSVNGKPFMDGTVLDSGIVEGSVIRVSVFKVPVSVKDMNGKTYEIMVDLLDSLLEIRKSVEEECKVPVDNQILFLKGNILEGDTTKASDLGIKEGAQIDLEPKFVNVTVSRVGGEPFEVKVARLDSVDSLKKELAIVTGLDCERQVLLFRGKTLLPESILKDLGICEGSSLELDVYRIATKIQNIYGDELTLEIEPIETISSVKQLASAKSGIALDNQKLIFDGSVLTNDKATAKECGIKEGAILVAEPQTTKLVIRTPAGTVQVQIDLEDTVRNMQDIVATKTKTKVHRLDWYFIDGNKFNGNPYKTTAKDLRLRDGSIVVVAAAKVSITIVTDLEERLQILVEPNDSVDKVKEYVAQKTNIAPEKQCIKKEGKEIDGAELLSTCGVKDGSILTVEPRSDPIIFVDVKCATLFALEREQVVERGVLTAKKVCELGFAEATTNSATKEKLKRILLNSPNLGIATQKVIMKKKEFESFAVKSDVQNKWGVALKARGGGSQERKEEKDEDSDKFIFVDPISGTMGELPRNKYIENGFLTPTGDTLKEAETDPQKYDKYVTSVRRVFKVQLAE